jgi:hypothetical protein
MPVLKIIKKDLPIIQAILDERKIPYEMKEKKKREYNDEQKKNMVERMENLRVKKIMKNKGVSEKEARKITADSKAKKK